jgi:hypothetical protein
MTLKEYQKRFKKKNGFEIILYYLMSIAVIIFGLIMVYKIGIAKTFQVKGNEQFAILAFSLFILLGVSGLYALTKRFKLTYLSNGLTKQENIDLINSIISELIDFTENSQKDNRSYTYKKSWWRLQYEINLYADNNLIAINVEGQDYQGGFIDFGASDRLKRKIIRMIKKRTEIKKIYKD